jgi:DNA-binding LytR/AlgR family response regulator
LDKIKSDTVELKVYDGLCRIPIDRLLAIQTVDRGKVTVYTSDAVYTNVSHSLKQLFAQLPSNFCYIRRDSIVNVHEVKRYILKLRTVFIVCQNREYPFTVSRENMKKVVTLFNSENRI